ncbi:MAG: hypothetical protein JXX28_18640 [Deltaproteobacteria bacterium]|nr:hypothetical protein [Deltaproteobacteria bacterium]
MRLPVPFHTAPAEFPPPWGVALAVLGAGLLAGGAGFANGDAAVYCAQGLAGDLSERVVHVGWIGLAVALGWLTPAHLPRALDAVVALAAAVGVLAVGRRAGPKAALAWGALALPLAGAAEVDLPWVSLALWAGLSRWGGALSALAVAVSPASLLALPWSARGRREVLGGALVATVLLSVASGGAWWWGDRGVLQGAGAWAPGRGLEAWGWGLGPGLLLALWAPRRWLLTLPLLLLPPDVPGWLLAGAALAEGAEALGRRRPAAAWVLLAAMVAHGALGLAHTTARVAREREVISAVVRDLDGHTGLIATWSWGVRASIEATGDPYALDWRTPAGVRDQAARWCAGERSALVALPPGLAPEGYAWVPDTQGVGWASGDGRDSCGAGE